jgi:hypothetical protein
MWKDEINLTLQQREIGPSWIWMQKVFSASENNLVSLRYGATPPQAG